MCRIRSAVAADACISLVQGVGLSQLVLNDRRAGRKFHPINYICLKSKANGTASSFAKSKLLRRVQRPQRSLPRYAALHGAMNPGFQKGDLGLAIEWPERRLQELGPKAGFSDGFDRRTLGLVPGNGEAIVRHRP